MAAHQANTWRWSAPTEEAHIFLDPRLLARAADESGIACPELMNRCAIDEFRGDETRIIGFAHLMNRQNVRMIEGRGRLGFSLKTSQPSVV